MESRGIDIALVPMTQGDLLNLPYYVDSLLKSNHAFKHDGALLFEIAVPSGGGTSLVDFMKKYRDDLQTPNKLNPISIPNSKDFYGHISLPCSFLETSEKSPALAIFLDPQSYSESAENCCIAVLRKVGVEGLLNHFFQEELPRNSISPPRFQRPCNTETWKQMATKTKKSRINFEHTLQNLPSHESRCAKLLEVLGSPQYKKREQDAVHFCSCWKCLYSENVLRVITEDGETQDDPVSTAKYYKGKGYFYASGINVEANNINMISDCVSLSFFDPLSVTSLLDNFYPGVNSPFVYFGSTHAFFPVHVEDLSLFSINFLHHGYPKLWVIIPPTSVAKLHFFLSKEFTHPAHSSCHNLLGHRYHLPTPNWLKRNRIPFKVIIQRYGQGIIVTPNAAHFGFSLGPNVAETTNFGTMSWIPYGIVSTTCLCMLNQVHPDLGLIIQTYRPDLLDAYLNQRIPKIDDDPHFSKSIIYNKIWKEAYDGGCDAPTALDDTIEGDSVKGETAIGHGPVLNPAKCSKKRPQRRRLICPLCYATFDGSHKKRLLQHIDSNHHRLSHEEKSQMQHSISKMFPVREPKMMKTVCDRCGKAVARSMKAHQGSTACIKHVRDSP